MLLDYSQDKPKFFRFNINNACHVKYFSYFSKSGTIFIYTNYFNKYSYFKYANGKLILPMNSSKYEVFFPRESDLKKIKGKKLFQECTPVVKEDFLESLNLSDFELKEIK